MDLSPKRQGVKRARQFVKNRQKEKEKREARAEARANRAVLSKDIIRHILVGSLNADNQISYYKTSPS